MKRSSCTSLTIRPLDGARAELTLHATLRAEAEPGASASSAGTAFDDLPDLLLPPLDAETDDTLWDDDEPEASFSTDELLGVLEGDGSGARLTAQAAGWNHETWTAIVRIGHLPPTLRRALAAGEDVTALLPTVGLREADSSDGAWQHLIRSLADTSWLRQVSAGRSH